MSTEDKESHASESDYYRYIQTMCQIEKPMVQRFKDEFKLLLKRYGFELTGRADDWALLQVITTNKLVFDIVQINDGSADFVDWT